MQEARSLHSRRRPSVPLNFRVRNYFPRILFPSQIRPLDVNINQLGRQKRSSLSMVQLTITPHYLEEDVRFSRFGFKLPEAFQIGAAQPRQAFLLSREGKGVYRRARIPLTRRVAPRHVSRRLRRLVTSTHWLEIEHAAGVRRRRAPARCSKFRTGQVSKGRAHLATSSIRATRSPRELVTHSRCVNRARLNAPAALSNASLCAEDHYRKTGSRVCSLPPSLRVSPLCLRAACTTNVKTRRCPGEGTLAAA